MRIALVCDWYAPRPGGIEAQLGELANHLQRAGHDVHIITSTPGPAGTSPTIHRLDVPRLPGAGVAFTPEAFRIIRRILERERIQLVHAHVSIVSPVALGGASQAQHIGLPTVLTFHSLVRATPLLAWSAGRLLGAGRWKAVFTAVSGLVASHVQAFTRAPVHMLPNAIDPAFWRPAEPPPLPGSSLLYVGRLQRKKRPVLALHALRACHAKQPQATLDIVGTGDAEGLMRRRARDMNLENHVRFHGWQPTEHVRDFFWRSAFLLSPSVLESFGLAALQASACGLPVLAMRQSAVSDFIVEGLTGSLVRSDADFCRRASELLNDREELRRLSAEARSREVPFSWAASMEQHGACYAQAIALAAR